MKKLFWAFMLFFAAISFVACDELGKLQDDDKEQTEDPDDQGKDENENNGDQGDDGNDEGNDLQPSAQKEKLASVGQQLMDKMSADEWNKYSQFLEDLSNSVYFSEEYDWGAAYDWFYEEAGEAFQKDWELNITGDIYTTSDLADIVVLMANHTGLFTLTEEEVVFSEYNEGTKAVFSLKGKTYEAEIKSSGKVTMARYLLEESDTWEDNGYWDENDNWIEVGEIEREHYNKISFTVGVPEQIDITLTENGSPLAEVTMKFTPSFSEEGLDPTTDSFSVQSTFAINGFEIVSEKIAYDGATGKASVKMGLKKNGESIFSTSASGDVKFSIKTQEWEESYGSGSYTYIELDKIENITASMDILGAIQAKGSVSNVIEAFESTQAMWDALYDGNTPDEAEAKRHLDNFNAKINLNVYYDGNNTKQAAVKFDLQHFRADGEDINGDGIVNDYDYYESWDLIPVIVFNDGSRYKIEEFFTESAFGELVDSFYDFCEAFGDIFAIQEEEIVTPV